MLQEFIKALVILPVFIDAFGNIPFVITSIAAVQGRAMLDFNH